MISPRKIPLLLWSGPGFVVGNLVKLYGFGALDPSYRVLVGSPTAVGLPYPVLYNTAQGALGVLLLGTGCGVWLSLRLLVQRNVPFGELYPLGQLRPQLYRFLPGIAGLFVAAPAPIYFFPEWLVTSQELHLVQFPAIFAGWFIAWAIWNSADNSRMRTYQILTPIMIIAGTILSRPYSGLVDQANFWRYWFAFSFVYTSWLVITSYWLGKRVRQSIDRKSGS